MVLQTQLLEHNIDKIDNAMTVCTELSVGCVHLASRDFQQVLPGSVALDFSWSTPKRICLHCQFALGWGLYRKAGWFRASCWLDSGLLLRWRRIQFNDWWMKTALRLSSYSMPTKRLLSTTLISRSLDRNSMNLSKLPFFSVATRALST